MSPSDDDALVGAIQLLIGDLPPEEQRRLLTKAVREHSSVVALGDVQEYLESVLVDITEVSSYFDGASPIGVSIHRQLRERLGQAVSYIREVSRSLKRGRRP